MKAEHRTSNIERRTLCERLFGSFIRCSRLLVIFVLGAILPAAAEINISKLPPPATTQVDFARDIQPIFEKSCLRCHGPEKPKSRFRLDNRDAALKGGANGIDIISGDSAKSPLIHYVAGLVEDMEMPPPEKGDPLTSQQISLLRAWIDQGANWSGTNAVAQFDFSVMPTLRYIHVSGNKDSFREIEGQREGSAGGLENFSIRERISADTSVSAEGHALFGADDFAVKLSLDKAETGFVRGGVEQARTYYDDSGAYYKPFTPPQFSLNRDLHLDLGRAWIDFGMTLPNWPEMVLGYEYQWKEGTKSTLQYGTVNGINIYPATKEIDEHTHILKFDLVHELYDWRIEDSARVEFYSLNTKREDVNQFTVGPQPNSIYQIKEGAQHTMGLNTVRAERQFGEWLFLSGGYLYSRFDGDASYDLQTLDNTGVPITGFYWYGNNISLSRDTHLFSVSSMLTGVEGLSVSSSFQNEWNRQEGFGKIHLDEGDPSDPASFLLKPATIDSNLDMQKFSDNFAVRFTKIPWSVLFAEMRWEKETVGQFEEQVGGGSHAFLRDTDADSSRQEYRAGFNTSPWRPVSFTAEYKKRISDSDYNHLRDFSKDPDHGPIVIEGDGYSAFILAREINTDELVTKIVIKPVHWLKTTLSYRLITTDYSTKTESASDGQGNQVTPGESIYSGNTDGHVFSCNMSMTPFSRLHFSTIFSYNNTRTKTADNGNASVVPYRGDIYSIITSANYVLNKTTDLQASYVFSEANYQQHNVANGVPLGIDYTRHVVSFGIGKKWTDYISTNLRYSFYDYAEPSSGNKNNYVANGVFATLTLRWP